MKSEMLIRGARDMLPRTSTVSSFGRSREARQDRVTDMFSLFFLLLMLSLVVSVCFFKSKIFCILFFLCNGC